MKKTHPAPPKPDKGPHSRPHSSAGGKKFITDAIKNPGALTQAVGGKPSEHLGKVEKLAKSGTPREKREASFYLNVLSKVNK